MADGKKGGLLARLSGLLSGSLFSKQAKKADPRSEITGWAKTAHQYRTSGRYNPLQLHEIIEGLRHGHDVRVYSNPVFSHDQMYSMRMALENGIDVGSVAAVARPETSWMDMLRVFEDKNNGLVYREGSAKERRVPVLGQIEERSESRAEEKAFQAHGLVFDDPKIAEIFNNTPEHLRGALLEALGFEQGGVAHGDFADATAASKDQQLGGAGSAQERV